MTAKQLIELQLSDSSGRPLLVGNVIIEIQFFVRGKYRFGFFVGRTDCGGHLRIPFADIELLRLKSAIENLMDYNTQLEDCDPTVRIVIPSEQQLRGRFDVAMRSYRQPPEWASPWPSNGRVKSSEVAVVLTGTATSVQIAAK